MGFGGSVAAMISSLKNNKRPKRNTIYDRREIGIAKKPIVSKSGKTLTEEEKESLRLQMQNEKSKTLLALLILWILILGVFIWLMARLFF